MAFLFAILAFLFMLFFSSTFRALINKENSTQLTIITSLLFGGLFWVCLLIWS